MYGSATICLLTAIALGSPSRADSIAECLDTLVPQEAVPACTDALASDSLVRNNRALLLVQRAESYAMLGDTDAASIDFDAAIANDPANHRARYGRGTLRLAEKRYDDAIDDFDAAIAVASNYMPALHNRGVAHEKRGDFARAIGDFTSAIALEPSLPSTFNNRGVAYRKAGNLKQALTDFDHAIALNPRYAQALANRATVHLNAGRIASATADFQTALSIDPASEDARLGLAAILGGDGFLAVGPDIATPAKPAD